MPPDDLVERPLPDPPRAAAAAAEPARLLAGRSDAPAQEKAEPDLIFGWAPFAVEFGQSWWLGAPEESDPAEAAAEPELAFAWAPFPVEFGGSWWLDPDRAALPDAPRAAAREPTRPYGVFGSFVVHLLPLLVLLEWPREPAGFADAIPVRLVLEKPRAATEEAPAPERLASENIGETMPQAREVTAPTPAKSEPPPPQAAAVPPPPPKPMPPPKPAPAPVAQPRPQPQPAPPRQQQPPARPATTAAAASPQSQRAVSTPGPDAVQGDYFSYLVTLTRRHSDLLPMSFLAGRRGETILSVVVLGDGTIGHIAVKRSSGYPDIDARIEQMVAAVGRFPPPPQRYQGSLLDMDFKLAFPNGLEAQ